MSKVVAISIIVLGLLFFLLKDEVSRIKAGLDALNQLNTKLDTLNKELEKYKVKFDEMEIKNGQFQAATARYIQQSTEILNSVKK